MRAELFGNFTDLRRMSKFVSPVGPDPFIQIQHTKDRMWMLRRRERETVGGVQLFKQMHMRLRQTIERLGGGDFAQRGHAFRCDDLDGSIWHAREFRHIEFRQICNLAWRIAHALHLGRFHRDESRHPFFDAHQMLKNFCDRPRLLRWTRLAQRLGHRIDSRHQLHPRTLCILDHSRQPGMHGRSSRHCRAVR